MDQTFILPIPKGGHRQALEENHLDKLAETQQWQQIIDRLLDKKLDWDTTLGSVASSSHPIFRVTTTQDNQTIFHLAVLLNKIQSIDSFLHLNPHLKYRPNAFGLNPYELSLLLPRKEISQMLHSSTHTPFITQPNVLFTPSDHLSSLEKIEYLSQPLFQDEKVLKEILTQSRRAKMDDVIPPERIWMGIYFDQEIQKIVHPKVSVRYIDDQVRFGVFAEQRIPPCAFLGEYTGVIQERKPKELKGKIYSVRYTVWEMGRRQFIIDAEHKGNFTRFINHSSTPNLALQSVYWRGIPRMIFVALKEILKGAQLTFDYGSFFWKEQNEIPILI